MNKILALLKIRNAFAAAAIDLKEDRFYQSMNHIEKELCELLDITPSKDKGMALLQVRQIEASRMDTRQVEAQLDQFIELKNLFAEGKASDEHMEYVNKQIAVLLRL